ncbi:MAG: hypothetical protein ACRYGK_07400 [Janthinobacterium lividum]
MSSAWECFHRSMYILVGPGLQQERLLKAWQSNLARLASKDVPAEIRTEFAGLAKVMNGACAAVQADGNANADANTNGNPAIKAEAPASVSDSMSDSMSDSVSEREVVALIHGVIRMYDVITRYQPINIHPDFDAAGR